MAAAPPGPRRARHAGRTACPRPHTAPTPAAGRGHGRRPGAHRPHQGGDHGIPEAEAVAVIKAGCPSSCCAEFAVSCSCWSAGLLITQTAIVAYGFTGRPTSNPRLQPPSETAGGQQELLPYHLRRKVDRIPPGPMDAFCARSDLKARFAQGSARSRFLRRNGPEWPPATTSRSRPPYDGQ
jgi:hypothetical protein